tara:strand:+ start:1295 stop:2185 length:891 start_codon:yes stop_codon:yes gene_type:complete
MSTRVSCDEPQPLYHYAEGEPDLYSGDFGAETVADEGYLPVDVEYERPNRATIVERPAPPRRLSLTAVPSGAANSYPPPPPSAPTLPPPRLFPKVAQPDVAVRAGWRSYLGLVGLVGLAGLGGAAMGGTSSSSGALSSVGGGACIVGTVQWSAAAGSLAGHVIADGSAVDAARYPDLAASVGETVPDLMGRYARGGLEPGAVLDASVDADSLSIRVFDPGHSHIDETGFSVRRDGQYSLAHLYTFTTSGLNLKDAGPAITAAETGITATVEGGAETRPASVVLVPHICAGPETTNP